MRRINAPSLIELSVETLRSELQGDKSLSGAQRYALAMAMSALTTARAEILADPEAIEWQLLDYAYDDGEGTLKQFCRDIRSKKINDESHPELRRRLEAMLVAELEVRNPQVLKRRKAEQRF